MSRDEDKFKHSKRLHQEQTAIDKQVKIAKVHGINVKEPHKLAKHHALDCGIPDCPVCSSPRKTNGEATKQEQSFKQTEKWDD